MLTDPHPAPHLLEVHQVARQLSVSQRKVWDLIKAKQIVAFRLGPHWRVDPRDLQAFIDAQREANGA